MGVFPYKPSTVPKITARQRTMMTVFPEKKKKKEHVHTINCVSRGQTTFFTLLVFLVRLVRSSYCVVFNILIRHKRDLTEKQSLTGQF